MELISYALHTRVCHSDLLLCAETFSLHFASLGIEKCLFSFRRSASMMAPRRECTRISLIIFSDIDQISHFGFGKKRYSIRKHGKKLQEFSFKENNNFGASQAFETEAKVHCSLLCSSLESLSERKTFYRMSASALWGRKMQIPEVQGD